MKIVLIIPPFTQINSTYPSITQLSGFLRKAGFSSFAVDLSLNVFLRIYSNNGLSDIYKILKDYRTDDKDLKLIIDNFPRYIEIIDLIIEFLQGKNDVIANLLIKPGYIPLIRNLPNEKLDLMNFGFLGNIDRAKYYSTLMINDIYYAINKCISKDFGLSRYAEKIALSPKSFDNIYNKLKLEKNILENIIIEEYEKVLNKYSPQLMCFSIPFPGNLYSSLLCAKYTKQMHSNVKIAFGGGYINTELRKLNDIRFFEFVDYVTYDDGELPILNIANNIINNFKDNKYVRTLLKEDNIIKYYDNAEVKNIAHKELPKPCYEGIEINKYVSVVEMLNPMSKLWTDGYWNKLAIAHGCYWKKCTFCDITLDYIKTYSPTDTFNFVGIIKEITKETGKNTFHFTDEAAPPSKLKELAIELIKQKANICWWGNIRFDKAFTRDLCKLLSLSGCIAVSGGIEIAEPRLLDLIEKGVTLEQAIRVTKNFRNADILVHAYLMYGFPTQTELETINSLEYVRQFMKYGLINSAYWHRFSLTVHSPIAKNPEKYNIKILSSLDNPFANNDLQFIDLTGVDHSKFTDGLNKALYNYMLNNGLNINVTNWFNFKVPKPTANPNFVESIIKKMHNDSAMDVNKIVIWNANMPQILKTDKNKVKLIIKNNYLEGSWIINKSVADKIIDIANESALFSNGKTLNYNVFKEIMLKEDEKFFETKFYKELKEYFLLIV